MGTWGAGNFENDDAGDYRDAVAREFIKRIEQTFDAGQAHLDEDGEGILIPSVQILSVLHEAIGCAPPNLARVISWKERYLRIYDEEIDGLEPKPDFKIRRREVIQETFEKLEQQAHEYWDKLR